MDLFANDVLEEWYAPDFRDNREKPEAERAEVKLKPLSTSELKQIESSGLVKISKSKDILGSYEKRTWAAKTRVLRTHIGEVRNFFQVKNGERKAIATADELVDFCLENEAALIILLEDMYGALLDRTVLDEGLRKNSSSRSVL